MNKLFTIALFIFSSSQAYACSGYEFSNGYNSINQEYRPRLQATATAIDEMVVLRIMNSKHLAFLSECYNKMSNGDAGRNAIANLHIEISRQQGHIDSLLVKAGVSLSQLENQLGQESYGVTDLLGTLFSSASNSREMESLRNQIRASLRRRNELLRIVGEQL